MLDTPPAPESKRPRLDYLHEPFTPAETREQAFQAARQQSLDGLVLVSAGPSSQPSPGGYFSVVIRNRFPVEHDIPAGVVVEE